MRFRGDIVPTTWRGEPDAAIVPSDDGKGVLLCYGIMRITLAGVSDESTCGGIPFASAEAAAQRAHEIMGAPADPAKWRTPGGLGAICDWRLRWHMQTYGELPEGYTPEHPWDVPPKIEHTSTSELIPAALQWARASGAELPEPLKMYAYCTEVQIANIDRGTFEARFDDLAEYNAFVENSAYLKHRDIAWDWLSAQFQQHGSWKGSPPELIAACKRGRVISDGAYQGMGD